MATASAAVQTTVALNPALGLAGQEYDSGPKRVITKIAQDVVPFGTCVSWVGEGAELPDSATEITARDCGIALRDPTKPSGQYEIGDPIAIMIEGFVWVPTEEAVAVGDAVYARHTAGAGGSLQGVFRNDIDTASCAVPVDMRWHKGGTALAVLRVGR